MIDLEYLRRALAHSKSLTEGFIAVYCGGGGVLNASLVVEELGVGEGVAVVGRLKGGDQEM